MAAVAILAGAATVSAAAPAKRSVTAAVCPLPTFGPGASYHPTIVPSRFSPRVTNSYFPLPPARVYIYSGVKDGKAALDIFTPTARTKVIDGVRTRVVQDRLYLNSQLSERTADYYAQDRCGNVWYFGENTAELDANGHVTSTSGSFLAGVKGAQPGVFMQTVPELNRRFRQEWSKGQAEDTYRAIDRSAVANVPFGHFDHALRTEETTALEPGVVDNKLYARGVGELLETAIKGPQETLRLVEIIR